MGERDRVAAMRLYSWQCDLCGRKSPSRESTALPDGWRVIRLSARDPDEGFVIIGETPGGKELHACSADCGAYLVETSWLLEPPQ